MLRPTMIIQNTISELRANTTHLHKHLDSNLPLAKKTPTLQDYIQHLQMLHEWLMLFNYSLEVAKTGPYEFGYASNCKALKYLKSDLKNLNAERFIKKPMVPIKFENDAGLWGFQYVIDGSYLGASSIYQKNAILFNSTSANYFKYAADVSKVRWRKFLSLLDEKIVIEKDLNHLIQGAIFGFELFTSIAENTPEMIMNEK